MVGVLGGEIIPQTIEKSPQNREILMKFDEFKGEFCWWKCTQGIANILYILDQVIGCPKAMVVVGWSEIIPPTV